MIGSFCIRFSNFWNELSRLEIPTDPLMREDQPVHTDPDEAGRCRLDSCNGHSKVAIGVAVGKAFRSHRPREDDRRLDGAAFIGFRKIAGGFSHGVCSVSQNYSVERISALEGLFQSMVDFLSHGRPIVVSDFRAVLLTDRMEFILEGWDQPFL